MCGKVEKWKKSKSMEQNGSSCESSFCKDEKVEAVDDLLEECWFFDNLLNIRPKMPRCHSDPCPLISPDFLGKDYEVSRSKSCYSSAFVDSKKIQRAPSMPQFRVRGDEEGDKKGSFSSTRRNKLVHQPSLDPVVLQEASKPLCAKIKGQQDHRSNSSKRRSKLLRTPSLPPSLGREEKFQETDLRTGRSLKQPSTPTPIDNLPPRITSKSCSIPRYRPLRTNEIESIHREGNMETKRKVLNHQKSIRRSLSDLELEEVQGFKDLGFSFEKEALSPSLASIIPGLQEKNRDETEEDREARGPYLSEAWLVQSCAPPVPTWGSNMSPADMKQQIKFWARAVASNVH